MSEHLIVAIDDDESEVKPNVPDGFKLEVVDPNDEKLSDKLTEKIGSACLILLDQRFNTEAEPKLSLKASDGASFVAHLRSWSRQEAKALAPIVLFTADDEAFKNEIPAVGPTLPLNGSFIGREFQIAPALDVEWVQHKDDAKEKIGQLAWAAVHTRSVIGNDGASLDELEELLGLTTGLVWTDRAKEAIRGARPPITQQEATTPEPCGPSQVIRWLCHRALPFPGMLLSDLYAAWALGISVEAFNRIAEMAAAQSPQTPWLSDFDDAEYYGPLDKFLGRRWWRSGIDYIAFKLDQETSKQKDRTRAFNVLAPNIELGNLHSTSTHVVTWTADLIEDDISSIDDSVQLRPPGWPVEALEPWILRSELENDAVLQAMAESADLT